VLGLTATIWDELKQTLVDEPYSKAAANSSAQTQPLSGGRTSVCAGRWDIQSDAKAWLASHKSMLQEVGLCQELCWSLGYLSHTVTETGSARCHRSTADHFPFHRTEKVVNEADLYNPIVNTVYAPVNLAAEALGLSVMYSKAKGKLQSRNCLL